MVEKLVPKLRFNEFHDGWNTIFLNNILSFKNGFNASKDQYGFGTKFINVSDILENNYLTYDNIQDYVNVDENELSNYIIEYGDIVFQRSSENREEVGTANVYLGSQPCVYGGFVIRGKKEGNYNPFFLKELLQSTRVRKEITSWSGGSTRYNIGQDSLNKISVSLPSIEEQNKIADLLLKVYEKIDLLNYKFQCYNNFKKYLMQQIFTQKLRFDFNDEWNKVLLNDVAFIPKKTKLNDIDGLKLLTVKLHAKGIEINDRIKPKLTKRGRPYYIRKSGELLIGRQNFHNGGMGIVPQSLDGGICSNAISSFKVFEDKIDVNYLYYFLARPEYYIKSERLIGGTGQKEFSEKELLKLKIDLPSLEEQSKIVDLLLNMDNKIQICENQLNKTQEFKKGLLQQMFV